MWFHGLLDIDWRSLDHAFGSAWAVPGWLHLMRSKRPEHQDRAFSNFYSSVLHQGSVYSSTVAAVPFLVEIAKAADSPDRARVATLVSAIGGSAFERFGSEWVYEHVNETVAALRVHADDLVVLADDSDPLVRRAASPALAWCFAEAHEAAAAITERFAEEGNLGVQLALMAAAGVLGEGAPNARETVAAWLDERIGDEHLADVVRFAAVVARSRSSPDIIPGDLVSRAAVLLAGVQVSAPGEEPGLAAVPGPAQHGVPPEVLAAAADIDRSIAETTVVSDLLDEFHTALAGRVGDRRVLLAAQLAHPDPAVRLDACRDVQEFIGSWRGDHSLLIAGLADLLDGPVRVAAAAAEALERCSAVAGVAGEPLAAFLARQGEQYGPGVWAHADRLVREAHQNVVRALARLGDDRAVPHLAAAFASGVDVWRAVHAAGHLPQGAPELVPCLVRYLEELTAAGGDSMSVNAAVSVLGKLGDPQAHPVLLRVLASVPADDGEHGPSMAPTLLEAIGRFGPAAAAAAPLIAPFAAAENLHERGTAMRALWRVTGNKATAVMHGLALLNGYAADSGAALLAEVGADAAVALPHLRELMAGGDNWKRVHAADAVLRIGGLAEIDSVLPVLLASWERNTVTGRVVLPCLEFMGAAAQPALDMIEAELAGPGRDWVMSIEDDEAALAKCRALVDRLR